VPCFVAHTSYDYQQGVSPQWPALRHAPITTLSESADAFNSVSDWLPVMETYLDMAAMNEQFEDLTAIIDPPPINESISRVNLVMF
jgi:hypothetical protein